MTGDWRPKADAGVLEGVRPLDELGNRVQEKASSCLPFLVPPLGIEPGPTEPESVILSFKLQGHPVKDCKYSNFFRKDSKFFV